MSTPYHTPILLLLAAALATFMLSCGDEGSGEAVDTVELGSFQVDSIDTADDAKTELTVSVPDGAESVAIVVQGGPAGALILADTITSPSDTKVFDFFNDITTNRVDTSDGLYTVLIPNNPEVNFESGDWKLTFVTDGDPYNVNATALVKNEAGSGVFDLNLFFAGVDGLDASTAPMDTSFQAALSNVGAIYGSAGISIGEVSYNDITDEALAVVEGDDELATLFQTSSSQSNRALNFFFVKDLVGNEVGFTLLGKAGGVPGPPGLHGTVRSGVVVNMASFIEANASGDATMITEALDQLEIIMAHEAGHYLGLYHTTERNGAALDENGILGSDPLSDTPVCPDSADANGDMILAPSECTSADGGNLMFWSPPNTARSLSSAQGTVLGKNPVVQ
ncbi:MAG: hypothetical protein AAFS10_16180 [Myxococcota bacterium]